MGKLLFCVEKEMFFIEDRGLALLGLINPDFDHLSIGVLRSCPNFAHSLLGKWFANVFYILPDFFKRN
jgi:hypothetical protein